MWCNGPRSEAKIRYYSSRRCWYRRINPAYAGSTAYAEALIWWIRQDALFGEGPLRIAGRDGKSYPRQPDYELPQRIWELRDAGYTYREIAVQCHCSIGTVHRHLRDD